MRIAGRKWIAKGLLTAALAGLCLGSGAGCSSGSYQEQRPPVDQLSKRDRGLQSKDVLVASDQMAMDLLSLPELNEDRAQWRVVVAPMKDETIDRRGRVNYDIFIERLKTNLSQQGRGRVRLVENKDTFGTLRNRELEGEELDDFGQGDGSAEARVARKRNPDFVLYGTARDLPNRSTNFYQIEFALTEFATRDMVWARVYEVKTGR